MIVQFKRKPHGKTANLNDNDAKDRSEIYELNLDKTITFLLLLEIKTAADGELTSLVS